MEIPGHRKVAQEGPDPQVASSIAVVRRAVPFICLAALFLLLLDLGSRPLGIPDTWFHLALGEQFLDSWNLRDPPGLSVFATAEWVPTQWSAQVLASLFERWFGLPGVAWLFGACQLVFVGALYLVCRREGNSLPTALALFAAFFAASSAFSARPQVVSLVLLSITVGAWLQSSRDLRPRWWLVPVTWFWATAHGFWTIGVLVGVVCCMGLVMEGRVDRRSGATLLAVPALCFVAACLTPVGPTLLTTQMAVSERSRLIGEWGRTSFHEMPAAFAAAMFSLLIVLWARRRGVRWTALLLMLFALALTTYAVRLVALGGIIVAPLLAGAVQAATSEPHRGPTRREWLAVTATVLGCAVLLGALVSERAQEPENVPSGLAAELDALPDGSRVIVDGPVGSWLEWAHPGLQPTMDGMFDAYTIEYMHTYMDVRRVAPGWDRFIESSGAKVAVLTKDGPLSAAMVGSLDWRETAEDESWVLLQAP